MQEIPEEALDQIRAHILEGKKLKAIKLYREATDASLQESKTQVEALIEELEKSHPRQMADNRSIGCAGIVLLAVVGAGGLVAKGGIGF
ncbi:hypothetical protein RISK_003047 [Rhodopirellula islandica]|uniref:Transmembrane protein n=1 Tax=Rhodopirellula islandica TaxID=595434 RepID=A0A0J1EGW1_RHOIS|nr:hypothetical protein [Rhodopirellula islandica]KLU04779.1 hypothetical protein RISK_003047 [Rhodopirellula islandica]